ncbi:MAG: hypothetical protein C4520_05630 [Candidatus Abyssobacteria bacterium SURF_5]|jgi:hypothetical protein|uniref:Lipoprotein n=1 Tax=Abyssobacteria bacterium (strain SURF_5) TaxID=2093360 RepID=A0A3A4NU03_ABYX5|nr:MAG: hypothetical protein C4520_05630 [Candidatus Abyssubacteria bacterium SURF_5]
MAASMIASVLLISISLASCASAPEYPIYPPPITETLPVSNRVAFQIAREILLEDPRVEIHTIDPDGRIVVREISSGFIFWQERTILDFFLQPADSARSRITMYSRAEGYEWGGLTRPAGWYPSAEVDTFLAEDLLGLIKTKAAEAAGR